ncbi:Glycosyl transferase, group 1 [Nitrospira japonica]|uniref:Glycosyl transferase, group 1 n=2 Tax=Nitrospira japonica TaxID=1325564 RepID=A0A1W1IBP8_9BACT|nr:Glycosyl transferase, group 1 [Nitrospira japonica]
MISGLAALLISSGFRVMVGLFRPGWLQEQCQHRKISVHVLPLSGIAGWRWFVACLKLVRTQRIDLIHAHEFSAIVCGWVIARLAGIPFVGTVHGKNYFWERARRRLAYRVISGSGRLVAVSQDLRQFVMEKVGLSSERIDLIYNGVESGARVSNDEARQARAELGLAPDNVVIGAIGSLYPVKGHQFLLEAMPAVLVRYPHTVLLVMGRGELEDTLKEQAKRLGLEGSVRFLGMRNDIPKLLGTLDVFVLPSLSEGLSLALLEAMAAGIPAVATKVGGNAELVVEGETGVLVPSQDAAALSKALCSLLDNRETRERFGRSAVARVEQRFSAGLMAKNYQRLYMRVLNSY